MDAERRARILSYGVVAAAILTAAGSRAALAPVLGVEMPLILFFPAVIVAALFGGMRLGLIATVVGCALGLAFFVEPVGGFLLLAPADWVRVILFLLAGLVMSWLISSRRLGWEAAAAAAVHLTESEARLAEAVRVARLGIWDYDAGADIVRLDSRCRQIFGVESAAMPIREVFAVIDERDRARIERELRGTLDAGAPADYEREYRIVRADGTPGWVAVRGHAIASGTGADRRVSRIVGIVMDVTERKQSEVERDRLLDLLRCEHARSVETLESIGDAFYAIDADFRFTYLNRHAEQWWGRGAEELIGKEIWSVFPGVVGTKAHEMQLRVMRERKPAQLEFRSSLLGRWMDLSIYPAAGGGLSCYFRDIDERKRAEQALREADRRKDEFLAVLGHELRNPLAPLKTGLELLNRVRAQPELNESVHAMMQRQLSHLSHLVDDLLDLSRISHGDIQMRRASLDLRGVVEAAVELTRPLMKDRRHELTVQRTDVPLPIDGDLHRLTQVLGNLLGNAARYTDPGGAISLRTEVDGAWAVVRVRDNGLGIPGGQLETIFEMFTQVPDHRVRTGGGGLGIGLSLSRQLVELHGGTIQAHSEGLGKGSEFTLRLPLAPAAAATAPRRTVPEEDSPGRRVLVVDDNVDAAESLRVMLELKGHDVRVAHDGAAALDAAERFGPEVVLLDIGLPRMDGYEVARRIRAMPGGEKLRLVALTGWGQEDDKRRAREAGFDEHLTKPVDSDLLVARMTTTT